MEQLSIWSLAQQIKESVRPGGHKIVFFLGAGASESSGIPTAHWMIEDFARQLRKKWVAEGKKKGNFQQWLESHKAWKNNTTVYGRYFECFRRTELHRLEYLHPFMKAASPSWGYFCLAQLMANKQIHMVVTTNFDDLVYEASTQYTVVRPRVYSTATPLLQVEMDEERPTVIKLHGDFLYSRINITSKELRRVDKSLEDSVANTLQTHDVVVIGCSGSDLSIRNLFSRPAAGAVYWCTHQGSKIPQELLAQIKRQRGTSHLFEVRVKGFDYMMDDITHELGFNLPDVMRPIQARADSLPARIEGSPSIHDIEYPEHAEQEIAKEEAQVASILGNNQSDPASLLLLRIRAMLARKKRDCPTANDYYGRLYGLPGYRTQSFLIEYATSLELQDKCKRALELGDEVEKLKFIGSDDLGNFGWLLFNLGEHSKAFDYLRQAVEAGPGLRSWRRYMVQLLGEAGDPQATEEMRELTELFSQDGSCLATEAIVEATFGDYENATKLARRALELPRGEQFYERIAMTICLASKGGFSAAANSVKKIESAYRDDVSNRYLSQYQLLAGHHEDALRSVKLAVGKAEPATRPMALALHGIALTALSQPGLAKKAFKDVLQLRTRRPQQQNFRLASLLAFAISQFGVGDSTAGLKAMQELISSRKDARGFLNEAHQILSKMSTIGISGVKDAVEELKQALS